MQRRFSAARAGWPEKIVRNSDLTKFSQSFTRTARHRLPPATGPLDPPHAQTTTHLPCASERPQRKILFRVQEQDVKRVFVFCCMLLLCSLWLTAQQKSQSSEQAQNWSQVGGPNQVAVRGCLTGSGRTYLLQDASGRTWNIAGNVSELKSLSGHEVLIAGTRGGTGAEASPMGLSVMNTDSAESFPWTLAASKITNVSNQCTTSP
jgi:hypothetical protein